MGHLNNGYSLMLTCKIDDEDIEEREHGLKSLRELMSKKEKDMNEKEYKLRTGTLSPPTLLRCCLLGIQSY